MASAADDERYLRRCLTLARKAEGRTSPNPIVGCVVVSAGGKVLAEGYHRRAGELHAEAEALGRLGGRARGATVYVNLEPCAHEHGRRTQPCTPMLAAAGIGRLVFGVHDPYPGHGGGARTLAKAGVRVDGPLLEDECRRANAPWLTYATERRTHVTLKAAMSLDGRIATRTGESRWITGEAARAEVHELRNRVDAVLVGAGTVRADDPQLTVRGVRRGRDPIRVLLDGKPGVPLDAKAFKVASDAPTWIATTRETPRLKLQHFERLGARVLQLPSEGGKVSLSALVRELARHEVLSLLVEGGGETHASFVAAGLCDRLLLYVAPVLIGGRTAPSWLGGDGVARLAKATRLALVGAPRQVGEDLALEFGPPASH